MILYSSDSWVQVVFTAAGSVWPNIKTPFFAWVTFAGLTYGFLERTDVDLGEAGHTVLGSTMSFLLIFRANQSYARYWQGRTCVSNFFAIMRDFLMLSLLHVHGGVRTTTWRDGRKDLLPSTQEDQHDVRARAFRQDVVRLSLAYVVLLKTFTRLALDGYCFGSIEADTKWALDWDRLRLRQLLTEEEFKMVDACVGIADEKTPTRDSLVRQFKGHCSAGPPDEWPDSFEVNVRPAARMQLVVSFYLHNLIFRNMNDVANSVPHGMKERFVPNLFKQLRTAQDNFDVVNQIMATPLALPYACLCKTLLTVWMFSFPFVVERSIGYFGGLAVPIFIIFALLGIDAIATELENPFGDDLNDLDLLEAIHNLETEAMEFLELNGDHKARESFLWRRMPAFIADQSCKPIHRHLAYAPLSAEEVASAASSAASSYRSEHRSSRSGSFK